MSAIEEAYLQRDGEIYRMFALGTNSVVADPESAVGKPTDMPFTSAVD